MENYLTQLELPNMKGISLHGEGAYSLDSSTNVENNQPLVMGKSSSKLQQLPGCSH